MGTAAVVTNSLIGALDMNVIDGGPATILNQAINNDPEALRRLADTYTFQVAAETSSNNDPVTVVNLNTQGLTWVGDNNFRNITTKAWWRNVAGTTFGYSENVTTVKGSAAGTTPVLSVAGLQTIANDRTYRVRNMMTTTNVTPVFPIAATQISSASVVVRCQGAVAGQDLRWLVEVDVGPLKVVPVAVT